MPTEEAVLVAMEEDELETEVVLDSVAGCVDDVDDTEATVVGDSDWLAVVEEPDEVVEGVPTVVVGIDDEDEPDENAVVVFEVDVDEDDMDDVVSDV